MVDPGGWFAGILEGFWKGVIVGGGTTLLVMMLLMVTIAAFRHGCDCKKEAGMESSVLFRIL